MSALPCPSQDWVYGVCVNRKVKDKKDILGFVFTLTTEAALFLQMLINRVIFIASFINCQL